MRARATLKIGFASLVTVSALGCILLAVVFASPPGRPSRWLKTAIVLPPPKIPLKFPHSKHREGFKCVQCHKQAQTSSRAADLLLPKKKVCIDCHDEAQVPKGFGTKGNTSTKTCRKCHTQFNARGVPVAVKWPKPRLRFPHRLHSQRKIACLTCHKGVEKAGPPDGKLHLPTMKQCFKCHDGKAKSPPSRCVTCHERVPGGRMRIHYPEGSLKPGRTLPRLAHGPLFRRNHKTAARAHRKQCEQCHQRSTCLKCHGGIRKPASIHIGNYILRHGREARANRSRCKSCHTSSRFCKNCHAKVGFNPKHRNSPYRTPGIKRFHGTNWASSTATGTAANRHATHARRNVGVCVSCHTEKDCMRCHARRRHGGLGRNPHGPGFRHSRRCKVLLRKNRRACYKCHGFNDPLMTMCR